MDENFITAGVAPGGLYSREEIRLLLCVLAKRLTEPLTTAVAEQVFAQEGLANYFEYHAALQELLACGQLECVPQEGSLALVLPEAVAHAAGELSKALPRRVCDRAVHTAERLQEQNRREQEHQITVYPAGEGCYMTFRQGEQKDLLMSVTVYLPGREQAQRVRAQFLENPGKLFAAVINALN
jgi:hypothetical protein